MLNRRQFLGRSIQGASLLSFGTIVPQFIANTASAAEVGKDTILVIIEMTGGNDGLNTVIPYADDLYHKNRPTLAFKKEQVIKVDDHIGIHPGMKAIEPMVKNGEVAIVQGVGYPNPDRSHFESMDIWQSAQVRRKDNSTTGWLARSVDSLYSTKGGIPVMQMGPEKLPVALQGVGHGVASINNAEPFKLNLGKRPKERMKLIEELSKNDEPDSGMKQFIQRRQLQTYATLEKLQDVLKDSTKVDFRQPTDLQNVDKNYLGQKLTLVSRIIGLEIGTRVFYVSIGGFDTHAGQGPLHEKLLKELGDSIAAFYAGLKQMGHDKRVAVMTYSEFGRRVDENGSKGTDHGSGSCNFVMGPGIKGGACNKHPSLKELDQGDLKYHTDFRRVYATLLDNWLMCNSKNILGEQFEHLDFVKKKG